MIVTVTPTEYIEDGVVRNPTNIHQNYISLVGGDLDFFHVEFDGNVIGRKNSEIILNGIQYPTCVELINEIKNIRGWVDPVVEEEIDFAKRMENVQQMNSYMSSFIAQGTLTQANFDLFLNDTATNVQGYLNGGGRLITWIETTSRNGYNATTVGFKTRTAYRGTLTNGVYPRAEAILTILNNL